MEASEFQTTEAFYRHVESCLAPPAAPRGVHGFPRRLARCSSFADSGVAYLSIGRGVLQG